MILVTMVDGSKFVVAKDDEDQVRSASFGQNWTFAFEGSRKEGLPTITLYWHQVSERSEAYGFFDPAEGLLIV